MKHTLPLICHEMGGKGSSVIMLHGWGMHSGLWGRFASALARHHRVCMIDLPGHGRNLHDRVWALDELTEHLLEATDSGAHWLGWSLGGAIAIRAARLFPERVRSLVLCCATPRFRADDQGWPGMSDTLLARFSSQLQQDYDACMRRFISLQTFGLENGDDLSAEVSEHLGLHAPGPMSLASGLHVLESSDLREDLYHLPQQVMAIYGSRDRVVSPLLCQVLGKPPWHLETRMIHGAGHMPFLSHRQTMLELVLDFLERQDQAMCAAGWRSPGGAP